MNRKGFEINMVIQLILWSAVIIIIFFLIKHYIVGSATNVPGEGLLP